MHLLEAAKTNFKEASLEDLRAFCERLGIEASPQCNASTLRNKLTAAFSDYLEVSAPAPALSRDERREHRFLAPKDATAAIRELVGINLKQTGKWGGKRQRIILARSMSHENTSQPQFFAWGRLHVYIPFGIEADVPYPIYGILLNTRGKRVKQRQVRDDESGRLFMKTDWVDSQRFMYQDLGVTPGTEDLPENERDRIRMLHHLTEGFKNFDERRYRALCKRLNLRPPHPKAPWGKPEMRGAVLARCGLASDTVDLTKATDDEEDLAVA